MYKKNKSTTSIPQTTADVPMPPVNEARTDKILEYQKELSKWIDLFAETDPATQKTAEGLVQKAAYMHSLCWELEQTIKVSGTIKIHPENPSLQKQIPAVKEYARLAESYANIVNKLNGLRFKNVIDDEEELKEFE